MDEYEILQYIEQSGGVSPYWLPKATPKGMIKFPKPQRGGLDKTDKILLAIGIIVAIVAVCIFIYRINKSENRLTEEMRKFEALKRKADQQRKADMKSEPELKPKENVGN